jgi:DNA-directed RNA polymerase subunit RPC12/RpoP
MTMMPAQFLCPTCGAKYEIVRIEAPPEPTTDREILCLSCGRPLRGREGKFVLKYFQVERPKRRA